MKTRNKSIADLLAYEGLIVNYQRVKKIQKVICKKLCNLYYQDEIVCPPQLPSVIFTTSAIDNIGYNQSSNAAKTSFYDTSVTAFQYPYMPIEKQDFSFDFKTSNSTQVHRSATSKFGYYIVNKPINGNSCLTYC